MPRLIRLAATLSLLGAAAIELTPAVGTAQAVVVARAVGQLNETLVRFVADNFKAKPLPEALAATAADHTPDEVITQLCGSVQDGYYHAFEAANGGAPRPHGQKLGAGAASLVWPACLHVVDIPTKVAAPANAAKSNISTNANASANAFDAVVNLVTKIDPHLGFEFGPVPIAVHSQVATVSSPSQLTPKDGVSAGEAATGLQRAAPSAVATATSHPMLAHIVSEVDPNGVDPNSEPAKACPTKGVAPYDAAAVDAAFRWSGTRRPRTSQGGTAYVYVVDNGIFAADLTKNPPYVDTFPGTMFDLWQGTPGWVGPVAAGIYPINYQNGFDAATVVAPEAGHGTHVAGLVVGGPEFDDYRKDTFLSPTHDGVELTIINLAKGQADFVEGAEQLLPGLLSDVHGGRAPPTKIVNMSLEFEGNQAKGVLSALFLKSYDTLFVVAAGNDHREASDIYPGGLGNKTNVISVAAHDIREPSHLTWFSNFGRTSVDIAAPGCGLESWLDGKKTDWLSGTSQSTPIVVFEATLLTDLDQSLLPWELKARILASGDLMAGDERWNVVSGSKINIPEAMLLYDDVIEVDDPGADPAAPPQRKVLIGDIKDMFALRCVTDPSQYASGRPRDSLWAMKAEGGEFWLFTDRNRDAYSPCPAATTAPLAGQKTPRVTFHQRARLEGGKVIPDEQPDVEIDFSRLRKVVFKGPYLGQP